jgi:multiple sugar transport system substrate-binding protein
MKMKKMLSIGLASAMVLSLAACGGSGSSSGAGAESGASGGGSSSSGGALTINIWDANQQKGIQEICDDWTALGNPKVKVEVVDWDNYWTLLEAGASGGTLPDVFWMHSDYAQMYMENDILLDLSGYIEKDGVDMSIYYPDIAAIYTRADGKIFALPKDHDTIALLYNKALFDQAGVEYPTNEWTYEDMYEAAKKITEATPDDTYGFALNTSNDQDGWYNYIYAYGGNVVNAEKTDTAIDSAESKAAMEMVRKMLTVGTPQAVVAESGTDSLFQSGKVGMITQGSWMINAFYTAENSKDYAWAEIPYCDRNGDGKCQKEERWSCYNGLGWAAAASTGSPDAAASLIEYLCSKDAQVKQAELGVTMAGIPGISDAFANAFEGMDVSAFTAVETDGTLYARPGTRNSGVWQTPMKQAGGFLDAWQDVENPQAMSDACDKVAKMIRDAIAQEK